MPQRQVDGARRDVGDLGAPPAASCSVRCPGARGATLLRETRNLRLYLTIDLWDTQALRQQMPAERKAEYSDLDAAFADWTESETEEGVFRLLAEATVHPRGRAQRSKAEETRRRNRGTTR